MSECIYIGIIGAGTVGSGVIKMLLEHKELLEARSGIKLCIKKIASRSFKLPTNLPGVDVAKDPSEIIKDREIDIVVELIGGLEPAREYILQAIHNGKSVVTANKLLLSQYGFEILNEASKNDVYVGFEGSVAGGIPIIRVIKNALIGNDIYMVRGIVNGTCNYILTKMLEKKADFDSVLKEAQKLGYAEKEPSLDIDGIDSAHKIAILAFLSFGINATFKDVYYEGIRNISYEDIEYARDLGYRIKLLGIAEKKDGKIGLRVHPTLLPVGTTLAKVDDVYNAIEVKGDYAGSTIYIGKGAGSKPTASSVCSDIVDAARFIYQKRKTQKGFSYMPRLSEFKAMELKDIMLKYYIRLIVTDKPGVLASISSIFGKNEISLKYVLQIDRRKKETVPLVIMTHISSESNIKKSLNEIEKLDVISTTPVMMRVIDDENEQD